MLNAEALEMKESEGEDSDHSDEFCVDNEGLAMETWKSEYEERMFVVSFRMICCLLA